MATEPSSEPGTEPQNVTPRDAAYWAKPVKDFHVSADLPNGAVNLVEGKRTAGPAQGFGKLWQKSYRMILPAAVGPQDLVREWKAAFGSFWPKGNGFYGPLTSLSPGDMAVLNLKTGGGVKLSTGVMVIYADEESFTFMTPQGHQFASWITFSAAETPEGTLVQIQPLLRASDPIYELAWPVMTRMEDRFWRETMLNLAAHFGVQDVSVEHTAVCVDRKRQWRRAKNVWHNAAIRSVLYTMLTPFRWIAKPFRRRSAADD